MPKEIPGLAEGATKNTGLDLASFRREQLHTYPHTNYALFCQNQPNRAPDSRDFHTYCLNIQNLLWKQAEVWPDFQGVSVHFTRISAILTIATDNWGLQVVLSEFSIRIVWLGNWCIRRRATSVVRNCIEKLAALACTLSFGKTLSRTVARFANTFTYIPVPVFRLMVVVM